MMRSVVLALCILALLAGLPVAAAADFDSALQAFREQRYQAALPRFHELAEQGEARSQHYLGLIYSQGLGVERDPARGHKWFRRAAEQGHVDAQNNLGFLHVSGLLGEPDANRAAQWFRRAAVQGQGNAQFNLGLMYATGDGREVDLARAYGWLVLAARQGIDDAATARRRVAERMDEGERERAEAWLADWRPPEASAAASEQANGGPAPAYEVQLFAAADRDVASRHWDELKRRHKGLLQERAPVIRRVQLPHRGPVYRLRIGAFDAIEPASALCRRLRDAGIDCFAARGPGR